MKITKTGIATTTFAAFALAACNDGGFVLEKEGGTSNVSVIEGGYGGFLAGNHTNYYRMLLVQTELWVAYGADTPAGFQASGMFQASGTIDTKTYTSPAAYEFIGSSGGASGNAAATYNDSVVPAILNGSFTIGANVTTFAAGPIVGANFNFNTAAVPALLGGTWPVTDLAGDPHDLVVSGTDGSFTLDQGDACEATGAFTGLQSRNAYAANITFSAGCPASLQSKTLNGFAFAYDNQNPAGTQLIAMFRDVAGNSVGYVLNGVK